MKTKRFTIKDFNEKYIDDNVCLHELFENRYKDIKTCTSCDKPFKFHKVSGRKCYSCAWCGYQLHPLNSTIFHKSPTSLKSWFYAMFLFSTSKNGVSAKELERQLGVTYKTAWRMARQIRSLLNENVDALTDTIEIDETYMGGKEKNKHKNKRTPNNQGRSTKTKTPIIGAIEREGRVIAKVVSNTNSPTIKPFFKSYISTQASVNTDEYKGYNGIVETGYNRSIVKHSANEHVNGKTHTNTIEGFWSQLKRSINGTYHFVSPKYLQTYVNEFSYRYNRRDDINPLFHSLTGEVLKHVI